MEYYAVMFFIFLWLIGLAGTFTFLAQAITGVSIIPEYKPWYYIDWYKDKIELYTPVGHKEANDIRSTWGVGIYTKIAHIGPRCTDPVAFNEACKMVYGTKRKELHMKFVPEYLK